MATKRRGSIVRFLVRTYQSRLKPIALVIALFSVSIAAAQNEVKVDSAEIYDEIVQEPPPELVETVSEDEPAYFMQKGVYSGIDSFTLRHLPDSVVKALLGNDDYLYGEKKKENHAASNPGSGQNNKTTVKEQRPRERKTSMSQQGWFQGLLWVLIIGGFMTFLIVWLSSSNIGLFRKKRKEIGSDDGEELSEEDIFAINYQREIDKAAASGNYRVAIRLLFLRLLKNMAVRNVIRYKHDSTNLDYLMQLNNSSYYNDFFRIARNYEYSWYGQFDIKEETYKIIRGDFDNFERKLHY